MKRISTWRPWCAPLAIGVLAAVARAQSGGGSNPGSSQGGYGAGQGTPTYSGLNPSAYDRRRPITPSYTQRGSGQAGAHSRNALGPDQAPYPKSRYGQSYGQYGYGPGYWQSGYGTYGMSGYGQYGQSPDAQTETGTPPGTGARSDQTGPEQGADQAASGEAGYGQGVYDRGQATEGSTAQTESGYGQYSEGRDQTSARQPAYGQARGSYYGQSQTGSYGPGYGNFGYRETYSHPSQSGYGTAYGPVYQNYGTQATSELRTYGGNPGYARVQGYSMRGYPITYRPRDQGYSNQGYYQGYYGAGYQSLYGGRGTYGTGYPGMYGQPGGYGNSYYSSQAPGYYRSPGAIGGRTYYGYSGYTSQR